MIWRRMSIWWLLWCHCVRRSEDEVYIVKLRSFMKWGNFYLWSNLEALKKSVSLALTTVLPCRAKDRTVALIFYVSDSVLCVWPYAVSLLCWFVTKRLIGVLCLLYSRINMILSTTFCFISDLIFEYSFSFNALLFSIFTLETRIWEKNWFLRSLFGLC